METAGRLLSLHRPIYPPAFDRHFGPAATNVNPVTAYNELRYTPYDDGIPPEVLVEGEHDYDEVLPPQIPTQPLSYASESASHVDKYIEPENLFMVPNRDDVLPLVKRMKRNRSPFLEDIEIKQAT